VTQPAAPPPPPGVEVFDPASGASLGLASPQEAADLYRSGRATFRADQRVVLDTGNGLEEVSGADAGAFLQSSASITGGLGTADAYRQQEEARQYDTIGSTGAAALAGAGRGLTFGLSDAAIAGIGGDSARAELQALQRHHEIASGVGELAGMAAPLAISGGTAAGVRGAVTAGRAAEGASLLGRAAEAATVLPRGVARLGAAAEGATARGLAGLGAAEGGLISRTLAPAAGQALEMGVYGAGSELSRQNIAGEQLSGEKLAAAFGHGALFGGAGGALLGAGGYALEKAATRALEGGTGLAERLTGRTSEITGGTLGERVTRLADTVAPGGLGKFAEDKALKSTGANMPILGKAEVLTDEVRSIAARQVIEDLPKALGKSEGAILSHVEQAEAAAIMKDAIGKQKGALVDQLAAAGVKADVPALVAELRAKLEPLKKSITDDAISAAHAGERTLQRLEENLAGGEIKELWAQQRQLGDTINWDAIRNKTAGLTDKHQAEIYFALGRALEKTGEKAEALGADFVSAWKRTNQEYTAADWIGKATGKGRERDLANRTAGLSEQLGALGGSSLGASIGGAVAGPLGAAAGSAVGGIAAATGQHLVKKYGDQAAAQFLARAAHSGSITEAAAQTVDRAFGRDISGFFKRAAGKAEQAGARAVRGVEHAGDQHDQAQRRKAAEPIRTQFGRARDQIAAWKANPQAREAVVAQRLQGAPPGAAQAAVATTQRGAAFLAEKMPTRPAPVGLTPQFTKASEPSPGEQAKFMRYWRTVNDPTTAAQDLVTGKLSRENVEALKAVYPQMYEELQGRVLQALAELKHPLPHAQANQLGLLMGVPADSSQQPDFIAMVQASYASQGAQGGGPPGSPPQGGGPAPAAAAAPPAPRRVVNTSKAWSLDRNIT
jgi:hypothetical protein